MSGTMLPTRIDTWATFSLTGPRAGGSRIGFQISRRSEKSTSCTVLQFVHLQRPTTLSPDTTVRLNHEDRPKNAESSHTLKPPLARRESLLSVEATADAQEHHMKTLYRSDRTSSRRQNLLDIGSPLAHAHSRTIERNAARRKYLDRNHKARSTRDRISLNTLDDNTDRTH